MDAKVMGGKYKRVDIIVGAVCADHVHLRFCTTGNADVIMEHRGLFCCICSGKSGAGTAAACPFSCLNRVREQAKNASQGFS